jgi:site-specific DNA recombinase
MGEIGRRLEHIGRAASPGATGVHPQRETALVSLTRELEIKPRGCDSRLVVTADQQAAPRRLASADQSSASRKQLDERLLSGEVASLEGLASETGFTKRYFSRMLRSAFLAPDIIERILDGL